MYMYVPPSAISQTIALKQFVCLSGLLQGFGRIVNSKGEKQLQEGRLRKLGFFVCVSLSGVLWEAA